VYWMVICSCGWERPTMTPWAANEVSKLHPQLAPAEEEHVTRIEEPPEAVHQSHRVLRVVRPSPEGDEPPS
jgi:hypothetical protein